VLPNNWIDEFLPHRNAKNSVNLTLSKQTYSNTAERCRAYLEQVEPCIAENTFHAILLRIEEVIRNNGGHASHRLLIDKLKISTKQLQEAIEAMGIGQRIALVEVLTKGRPRMDYILLDNKYKSE
jgi:hypothetical protein